VVLVRNASAEPARTQLRLPRSPDAPAFLLDAVSGAIRAAAPSAGGWLGIDLAPRDSVFVVAGPRLAVSPVATWPAKWLTANDRSSRSTALAAWRLVVQGPDIEGGRIERAASPLFDWRADPQLRLVSSPGRYETAIEIEAIDPEARYLLDLGRVLHAADVEVNGAPVARLLYSPFAVDVTAALQAGRNTLAVTVRSPLLNRFIGYGERGDARYARFAGREPLAAGLVGPVVLRTMAK
jgi:hypothetical protein